MDDDQKARLERASGIGKEVWFKEKGTQHKVHWGTVEDEVYILVGDYKHLIQRIRLANSWHDGSAYCYRTGYYTLDRKSVV